MKNSLLLLATLALSSSAAFAQCPSGQVEVVVAISTDAYGTETTWTLTGPGGSPSYATGGPYTDHNSADAFPQTPVSACIPIGSDVVFTIHDAYGDGMCCTYGEGSYTVTMNGCQTMASGGAFTSSESTTFTTAAQTALDLSVNSFVIDPVLVAGSTPITGTLQNYGSTSITSYDLNYSVDGGTPVTQSMTNTLAACATYAYTFSTSWNATVGSHDVMVWVSNVNGGSDDNSSDDSVTHTVSVASQTVPRVATIEEFGSSTCVPCANFNVTFAPLLESFNSNEPGSNVATIEYHMNWPSPGNDPSYNPDGNSRRGYYGVNAIPDAFIDGHGMSGTASDINSALAVPSFTDLQVSYVRTSGTDITVTANVTPYYNLDANIKVYIAITEDHYHYQASTTTQDDFEYAMRKMLPDAGGNALQPLVDGQAQTVTQSYSMVEGSPAQGNYHLWGSVDGITIVAFVQNADTKEILQGAISESHVGINEIDGNNMLDIYPNPTTGLVNLTYGKASASTARMQVFNVLGEQVMGVDRKFSTSSQVQTIDLSSLENGIYYMSIAVDGQRTTRRIVVSK